MLKDQNKNRPAGFHCPNCQFFIEMSIDGLLYEESQKCPGCSTVFVMNRSESREALELVQKLKVAMQNLDSVKEFKGSK